MHRIFTFVLITDQALAGDTAREVLLQAVHRSGPDVWPNMIFALDKFLVTFCCDSGVCPNPMDARGIALLESDRHQDNLLRFYLLLGQAISVTSVARMSYWAHLGDLASFESDVIHGIAGGDEPPPYLSSLECLPWLDPYDDNDGD